MKLISTLLLPLIAAHSFAQGPADNTVTVWKGGMSVTDTVGPGNTCRVYDPSTKLTGKISGLNVTTISKGVSREQKIVIRCGRALPADTLPLLIVDGRIRKLADLSTINPNDIASVTIVKSAKAMAIYGPSGANGVIVINLKMSYKQFIVIDSIDNNPVGRATAGITMKNGDNTMFYVADDNGVFSSNSPDEFNGLRMTVSAVGYETHTRIFNGDISATDTIRLKRNVKICEEVVISSTFCPRIIRCYGYAKVIKVRPEKKRIEPISSFRVYPNPVSKGSMFTTVFNSSGVQFVRLVNLNGQEMWRQPAAGKGMVQIQADPRWTAGVYFVQLVYENGRIGASGKMIIQ